MSSLSSALAACLDAGHNVVDGMDPWQLRDFVLAYEPDYAASVAFAGAREHAAEQPCISSDVTAFLQMSRLLIVSSIQMENFIAINHPTAVSITVLAPALIRIMVRLNSLARRTVDVTAADSLFDTDGTSFAPPAEFDNNAVLVTLDRVLREGPSLGPLSPLDRALRSRSIQHMNRYYQSGEDLGRTVQAVPGPADPSSDDTSDSYRDWTPPTPQSPIPTVNASLEPPPAPLRQPTAALASSGVGSAAPSAPASPVADTHDQREPPPSPKRLRFSSASRIG